MSSRRFIANDEKRRQDLEEETMSLLEDRTKVLILTKSYRISGEIALFRNERMTDYMVNAKSFIAVTAAEVNDHEGRLITAAPFLNVKCENIEVIVPDESAALAEQLDD